MSDIGRFNFSWKCPICKMHQRKEPHRRLNHHMMAAHDMVWSEVRNEYVQRIQMHGTERERSRGG
jgi:cation transport regulator ChaB